MRADLQRLKRNLETQRLAPGPSGYSRNRRDIPGSIKWLPGGTIRACAG
jgi:hypothetical protein